MQKVEIQSETGILSATIFGSINSQAVLIIASATGVKQSFYRKFAEFLSSQNITVVTFDYGGIGRSLKKPITALKHNAADWGTKDLESVISYVLTKFPSSKKYLLGHSIGGQLAGFSESSTQMDKIILIAAQSGYWKFWKGTGRMKMWFNWHILFPVLLNFFGYLPSKKISGMEDLPKNVAKQWSGWGKNRQYLFSEISLEDTVFNEITTDLTAISIEGDDFAPKEAVDWMTEKYSNAKIKRKHLLPRDFGVQKIGHFGIFREKFRGSLWQQLLEEIEQ